MASFSPLSFALGLVAASLLPALSRVFRPFAVEAAAAGLGMLDDARRFAAEQVETLEDIVAEAKARREHLDAEAAAGDEHLPEPDVDAPAAAPVRRRTNGTVRRRTADVGR
jgi:hypothetical protein